MATAKAKKSFQVGDSVKILGESYGWGQVNAGDIAVITTVDTPNDEYRLGIVGHPAGWRCKGKDIEIAKPEKEPEVSPAVLALSTSYSNLFKYRSRMAAREMDTTHQKLSEVQQEMSRLYGRLEELNTVKNSYARRSKTDVREESVVRAFDMLLRDCYEAISLEGMICHAMTKEIAIQYRRNTTQGGLIPVNFGKLSISIELGKFDPGSIKIKAVDSATRREDHCHPNVGDEGVVCFGTYGHHMGEAFGRYNLPEMLNILWELLVTNVTSAGAYARVELWATDIAQRCKRCWNTKSTCTCAKPGVCGGCGRLESECTCTTCPQSGETMEEFPDQYCTEDCSHWRADAGLCRSMG